MNTLIKQSQHANWSRSGSLRSFVKRLREWLATGLNEINRSADPQISKAHNKQLFAACLLFFFLTLGVRLLTWHDLRLDVWKVQTYVTSDYKYSAYLLARHNFARTIELYELGPSAYQWTRVPRFVIRNLQRFFLTAWMLPLTLLGIAALIKARRFQTISLLLTVPLYYLVVQSALHTERRYVIAIHYFLTIFAASTLWLLFRLVREGFRRLTRGPQPANRDSFNESA